jgi:hypothetical protein
MGGWDEAYSYWEHFGRFWDREALEWLKKIGDLSPPEGA